jgi:hypothetical protein
MGADFPDRVEDCRAIDKRLAERSKSEGKVGRLPERPRRENHAIPGIGIEGVNMHAVKLGVTSATCAPATDNAASNRRLQGQTTARQKLFCRTAIPSWNPRQKGKQSVRSLPFVGQHGRRAKSHHA